MNQEQLQELLYQALETEQGGILVYETALRCAINEDLKKVWTEYLAQTRNHETVVRELMAKLQLDTEKDTPGRAVVHHIGQSLVKAMEMALEDGSPEGAQPVATECVVLAETKDHMNWELMSRFAEEANGATRAALQEAVHEVGDEEDEHIYHGVGWSRELWIQSLGIPAMQSTRKAS
jgi:rubrerythrin